MPGRRNPARRKHTLSIRQDLWEQFEQARGVTPRTQALDEALLRWTQQRTAAGPQALVLAPLLEEYLTRLIRDLERRLRPVLVKSGVTSTAALEVLLEQRRRNGVDPTQILRAARPRIFARWRDKRVFVDTDMQPADDEGTG